MVTTISMLCEHLLLFQHLIVYLLEDNLCLLSGQIFGVAAVPYNINYFKPLP